MKKLSILLLAIVTLIGTSVSWAQIDVINHGTNLSYIASDDTTHVPLVAATYLGPVWNVKAAATYSTISNLPPTQLVGNRYIAFVSNTGSLTCGLVLGGFTNGATPLILVPPYSTRVLPLPGGYNGPIGARSTTTAGAFVGYSEMGGPPNGYIGGLSWQSPGTALMVGSNITAGVTVSAARTNGQQRTYFSCYNTNTFNVGLRFAGAYTVDQTPDVIVFSNAVFGVQFPMAYNGPITARALNTNTAGTATCYVPFGEAGY